MSFDLLNDYKKLSSIEQKELWIIMRYVCVILKIKYNTCVEIHQPRNTTEFYTYSSDKYWVKIFYGLLYLKLYPSSSMIEMWIYIHKCSADNLLKYWYPILSRKKYVTMTEHNITIKYYLYSVVMIHKILKDKPYNEETMNIFKILVEEDKCISQLLCYINSSKFTVYNNNREITNYFLNYIPFKNPINDELRTHFFNYLMSPINDPCIESENKNELTELIYDYL